MPALSESFVPALTSDKEIMTQGSILLVSSLGAGLDEPAAVSLTLDSNASSGATSMTVTAGVTNTYVRKGSVLVFGSNKVAVVTADTTVSTGTSLPVEALAASISTSDLGYTWGLYKVLSPSNIPLSVQTTTVDRTDLSYGLQKSEVSTGVMLSTQIQVIGRTDDLAFRKVINPAANSGVRIFAMIVRTGGAHAWGPAIVKDGSLDGGLNEIERPQFSLAFQAPFTPPVYYSGLSNGLQTTLNTARKYAGLATISA